MIAPRSVAPLLSDAAVPPSSTVEDPLRLTRGEAWLLAAGVLAFGVAAFALGQSNNWDLRNYHWYDGWAWLHGRGLQDLAAAQSQTWFNPVLPALLYALLSSVKPALGTFALGAVQGLNLLPLQRIARRVLPADRPWLACAVAVVGAAGATQRGELGATFGDNLVSLPLLGALALLLVPALSQPRIAAAGALLGLAVGLKLTATPIAAGIGLAGLLVCARRTDARSASLSLLGAAVLTALLVQGPWMWQLWRDFHNPLFPQFGPLFGGDFVAPDGLRDTRWIPRTALEWLFYPLCWASAPRRVSELWFLDLRVPLAYAALLVLPLWWRRARAQAAQPQAMPLLLVAFAASYLLWLVLFGYYRYLVVVEMLAPLLFCAAALTLPRRSGLIAAIGLLVVTGLATREPRWGRLKTYAGHYVSATLPALAQQRDVLVVFGDREPLGFLAPVFPDDTRFVRVLGNIIGPPLPRWALDDAVQQRIDAHRGPLLLLAVHTDDEVLRDMLQQHGLELQPQTCAAVDSNLFTAREPRPLLCELHKQSATQ